MHIVSSMWSYLDTPSRICIAWSCKDFYGQSALIWKHVIIPESMIGDGQMMPILICAQNIQTLKIDFPIDSEEEKASNEKMLELLNEMNSAEQSKNSNKETKAIQFPSQAIDPLHLTHLKQLKSIDIKKCGSNSYESFVSPFIEQLSHFPSMRRLCAPQLFTIRHSGLETLDIGHLQIGFDGMNVHLGADLIGITHLKKQLPALKTIYCDELYLFIGEDIYVNHEKSGKQYWIAMRKWCTDCNIKVRFCNPSITVMLMPNDKRTPPMICEEWKDIRDWMHERTGDFICLRDNL